LFGGDPVAFSKYEADDVTQSDAMDKLLRVVSFVPAVFAYLTEQ
jgi:HTH-type transcriptional regulator/antitoxin MqsA